MPQPNTVSDPEAEKILNRISLRYGLLVFALLIADTFFLSYADALLHPRTLGALMKPSLILLNFASILVVLIPFYYGIYKLFSARLAIGRERVQSRSWNQAVAALEPFDNWTQRFLDNSGEAHFLLAQAYTSLGDKTKAEAARKFVRRRKGVWADRVNGVKPATTTLGPGGQENRPRPSKGKPRRRF